MVSVPFAICLAVVCAVIGFVTGVVFERDNLDPPDRFDD